MSPSGLEWSILAPAFAAGLLVLGTHVPLGRQVLDRGIIFIDLAIAQIAALGVMAAALLGWEDSAIAVQLAAAAAAGCGALIMTWTERRWPKNQEALIGASFVIAASLSLLLLAGNPHGGEHLQDILAGQILWISWPELLPTALLYALILCLWFGLGSRLGHVGFYLLFAATVTLSVQLIGIYLVFASLILPALAAPRLAAAYLIGGLGYALGLLASSALDLPAGPAIVCALALVSALAALLRNLPGITSSRTMM
jgi:zinc/manganese transport system permease protein